MSIPVALDDLPRALAIYTEGYLITVSADSVPWPVAARPTYDDGTILVGGGRRTEHNLTANEHVTLLCPPREAKGFTLIVDGAAAVDGDRVRITPTSAVLHRPPYDSDGPEAPSLAAPSAAPSTTP
jgi:hypothetical protein